MVTQCTLMAGAYIDDFEISVSITVLAIRLDIPRKDRINLQLQFTHQTINANDYTLNIHVQINQALETENKRFLDELDALT